MALVTINWNPSSRHLRQFSLAGAVVFFGLAFWTHHQHGWSPYVWSLAVIGLGFGLCGGIWPENMRYPYLGLSLAAYPMGWVTSHVILGVIYFGLFTAVAWVFRLIGRDALQRRFEPGAATYWQRRQTPADLERYLRQF